MRHLILTAAVILVWRVKHEIGDVACVKAGKAVQLVREARFLVTCHHELSPDWVELLVVLLQAVPMLLLQLLLLP